MGSFTGEKDVELVFEFIHAELWYQKRGEGKYKIQYE